MGDQQPLYPEFDCVVEAFDKQFDALVGTGSVIRGKCHLALDDPPSQEATVEELVARFDEKMRVHRASLYQSVLSRCNVFKRLAEQAEARLAADIRQFGELPDGYSYRAEWEVAYWSALADKLELVHAKLRGNVIKLFMEEANYSANAFLALERVIISDYERRKVEPYHASGYKARFQADAIQKFKSGNKSKTAFSAKYSGQLHDMHGIIIDPRTIAESWLKGI